MMKINKRIIWKVILLMAATGILLFVMSFNTLFYTKVYPAFRSFEGYKLSNAVNSYHSYSHGNFKIRYELTDREFTPLLSASIDNYGELLFDFFDYDLNHPVDIIVYPSLDKLNQILNLSEDNLTMGAYYGGILNMLSPNVWLGQNQGIDVFNNVFVHEMTHLVVDELAKGNYPLWFTEGCALYAEYYLLDYEWGAEIDNMEYYSMDDLNKKFTQLDDYYSYRQSFLMVKGMIDKYGRDKFLEIIRQLGKGVKFDKALYDILGMEPQTLDEFIVPWP